MAPRKPKALPSPDETSPEPPSFRGALEKYTLSNVPPPNPPARTTKKRKPTSPPLPTTPPAKKTKPPPTSSATTTPRSTKKPLPSRAAKKPRQKLTTGYAPPSKYAHIPNHLRDALAPDLLALFVGLNPGLKTARTGHAYAHPSNLFWKLLHRSGCTRELVAAASDGRLPAEHGLGLTNIVARATRDGSELSRAEMDASVAALEAKLRRWRPEVVVLVGKGVWESVWRVRCGRGFAKGEFAYGWQGEGVRMGVGRGVREGEEKDEDVEEGGDEEPIVDGGSRADEPWKGARVFVATTTSGLAAGMKPAEKEAVWRGLGEWVVRRRAEREREREGAVEAGVEEEGLEAGVE